MSSLEFTPNQGPYRPPPLVECSAIPGNSVHLNCKLTRTASGSVCGGDVEGRSKTRLIQKQ